jgi:hypothetical protein
MLFKLKLEYSNERMSRINSGKTKLRIIVEFHLIKIFEMGIY